MRKKQALSYVVRMRIACINIVEIRIRQIDNLTL